MHRALYCGQEITVMIVEVVRRRYPDLGCTTYEPRHHPQQEGKPGAVHHAGAGLLSPALLERAGIISADQSKKLQGMVGLIENRLSDLADFSCLILRAM
jgi:hypothetical protein